MTPEEKILIFLEAHRQSTGKQICQGTGLKAETCKDALTQLVDRAQVYRVMGKAKTYLYSPCRVTQAYAIPLLRDQGLQLAREWHESQIMARLS